MCSLLTEVEVAQMACDSLFSIIIFQYVFLNLLLSWSFLYNFQVVLEIVFYIIKYIVNILSQLNILAGQMRIRTGGLIRLADRNVTVEPVLKYCSLQSCFSLPGLWYPWHKPNVPDLRLHNDNLKVFMCLKLIYFISYCVKACALSIFYSFTNY